MYSLNDDNNDDYYVCLFSFHDPLQWGMYCKLLFTSTLHNHVAQQQYLPPPPPPPPPPSIPLPLYIRTHVHRDVMVQVIFLVYFDSMRMYVLCKCVHTCVYIYIYILLYTCVYVCMRVCEFVCHTSLLSGPATPLPHPLLLLPLPVPFGTPSRYPPPLPHSSYCSHPAWPRPPSDARPAATLLPVLPSTGIHMYSGYTFLSV